ncbi:hypothetical protein NDU88_002539 [Pleurodeles waltl]|uniref:Uncharacterized protein n=1 Tax=Pleurodeles waltl TaxID=8319 RepID=A0AAV7VDZ9_PLEWA|nr:hypothetical protein NDU88_002539 [Pleurodeles waltl]
MALGQSTTTPVPTPNFSFATTAPPDLGHDPATSTCLIVFDCAPQAAQSSPSHQHLKHPHSRETQRPHQPPESGPRTQGQNLTSPPYLVSTLTPVDQVLHRQPTTRSAKVTQREGRGESRAPRGPTRPSSGSPEPPRPLRHSPPKAADYAASLSRQEGLSGHPTPGTVPTTVLERALNRGGERGGLLHDTTADMAPPEHPNDRCLGGHPGPWGKAQASPIQRSGREHAVTLRGQLDPSLRTATAAATTGGSRQHQAFPHPLIARPAPS